MGKSGSHNIDDPDWGPPYSMDIEARPGGQSGKNPGEVRSELYEGREGARNDARSADAMIEALPGLTRAKRDLERAYPRPQSAEVSARKRKQLPAAGEFRRTLAAGQRKVRSKTKRRAQDSMPGTEYKALGSLIGSLESMTSTNERLHRVQGNARHLDPRDRRRVQQIDRAVARYERESDRSHVVYFAARMDHPPTTPSDVPHTWEAGRVLSLDEYTMATHTMHEVDRAAGSEEAVMFELETRRGMYLGRSDSLDDTRHLLPRGIHVEVVDVHYAPFERPGGPPGDRLVIQLREVSPSSDRDD